MCSTANTTGRMRGKYGIVYRGIWGEIVHSLPSTNGLKLEKHYASRNHSNELVLLNDRMNERSLKMNASCFEMNIATGMKG